MSQGVGSESGLAVAPARGESRAGSDPTHKWVRRLFVLAGLLIYFGSFFLTAVKQRGDSFGGAFCAYYTLVWPWTDGLAQRHTHLVTFLSIMLSGWVNPTFLLICITPPMAALRTFAHWVLRPLWVLFAVSCWVVFVTEHITPTWGYAVWTLGMVMVLYRERLLATAFRSSTEGVYTETAIRHTTIHCNPGLQSGQLRYHAAHSNVQSFSTTTQEGS